MTDQNKSNDSTNTGSPRIDRRRFLLGSSALGSVFFAGCASNVPDSLTGGSNGGESSLGTFRLLISDQPVAIGEFDSLNVSFDYARIFRADNDDDEDEDADDDLNETDDDDDVDGNETDTDSNGNETDTDDDPDEAVDEDDDDVDDDDVNETETDDDDDDDIGFTTLDLEGETVDLTQVVGEDAMGVFEGELEAGQYAKIELHAQDVEGIVDGEEVEVMIPSGKLQITKPFEVTEGETVSFVFDINVVKRGNTGKYNLLPVISESGVAGQDVDVNEIDDDDDDDDEDEEEDDDADDVDDTNSTDDDANGSPDDPDDSGN